MVVETQIDGHLDLVTAILDQESSGASSQARGRRGLGQGGADDEQEAPRIISPACRRDKWSRYGKEIEMARVDQTGCSRIEVISSSKDTSSKDREIAQTDSRRNAAKGVCARRVVGFSRLTAWQCMGNCSPCAAERAARGFPDQRPPSAARAPLAAPGHPSDRNARYCKQGRRAEPAMTLAFVPPIARVVSVCSVNERLPRSARDPLQRRYDIPAALLRIAFSEHAMGLGYEISQQDLNRLYFLTIEYR
jgi:hypothetical protein